MTSTLSEAVAAILAERPERFDESFRLADRLLAEYGEDDLAERLYADIPPDCPWEVVADLLTILVGITSDNGSTIQRTAERWLSDGEDLRRVRVALGMDVYPFLNRNEMESVLTRVAARHPEVAGQIAQLLASRREINEGPARTAD